MIKVMVPIIGILSRDEVEWKLVFQKSIDLLEAERTKEVSPLLLILPNLHFV